MIEFKRISEFPKGTLYMQLTDAYSFDPGCAQHWKEDWLQYDDFIYSDEEIAASCGLVTVLDGKAIGHITWDPRNLPEYVIIGHNCILSEYKGKGYGKQQLLEAIRRIRECGAKKVIVTTNGMFLPARKNYESAGFFKTGERVNNETPFAGKYLDYELYL